MPTPPRDGDATTADAAETGPLSPAGVRALKISIVVMGALIVLGILGIIARIMYMAGQPKPGDATRLAPIAAGVPAVVALPAGAAVRHMALDGGRLAIHYEGAAGSGIKIVDLSSGQEVRHITLKPAVPAN